MLRELWKLAHENNGLVLSCLVLSCLVLSCLVVSCLVSSYFVLDSFFVLVLLFVRYVLILPVQLFLHYADRLLLDEDGGSGDEAVVLTDILGIEDALGTMDFKVAGNEKGTYFMVWYGMVWYGMVRYGMVWYGIAWYGMG